MHEMPAARLVQLAVHGDRGQERILGIERPVNNKNIEISEKKFCKKNTVSLDTSKT